MNDKAKYGVGIEYGYGIMQFKNSSTTHAENI